MWTKSYSQVFKGVDKEKVWQLWTDLDNWPRFNKDIQSAKLEGDFKVGEFFVLKLKMGPSVKVKITEIVEGSKFTDCTSFPGAEMHGSHEIEEEPDGLRLTVALTATGMLGKMVAEGIMKKVPEQLATLAELARANV